MLIACPSPSASGTGSPCAGPRPRARPNSSSAPTAPRTPSRPKESACGCAGIFNAPFALEAYAQVFEEEGALDRFEGFASEHGARFYGLPLNEGRVTLERSEQQVPERIGDVPFLAGRRWLAAAPNPSSRRRPGSQDSAGDSTDPGLAG